MAITDERYDAIVASIYAAAQAEKPWTDSLQLVVDSLNCWSGHLMGFDRQTGGMVFSHEAGQPPAEATLDYILRWHRSDPRNAVLLKALPDSWVHCHEHLSDAFVRSSNFYQDFLLPYGSRYVSGMHFSPTPDLVCILSFQRGTRQNPFDESERQILGRLGKHLRAAFLLQDQTRKELRAAVAGHAILQRLRHAVILIDQSRRLLYENPAGSSLLNAGAIMLRRSGLLGVNERRTSDKLTAAMQALTRGGESTCMAVDGGRGTSWLLHLAMLTPEETMRAFGAVPVFMLTLFSTDADARSDHYLIASAFGLTPAEARVAAAAAKGWTDMQVAQSAGTSAATVRTQIRSIYAKTGTERRADLVRLLNSSPGLWK